VKLNEPQNAKKKAVVLKAVKCLERIILNANNSYTKENLYQDYGTLPDSAMKSMANSKGSMVETGPSLSVYRGKEADTPTPTTPPVDSSSSTLLTAIKAEPPSTDDTAALLTNSSTTSPSNTGVDGVITPTNPIPSQSAPDPLESLLSSDSNEGGDRMGNNSLSSLLKGTSLTTPGGCGSLTDSPPPSNEEPVVVDPETYCKLGHFHLLLDDNPKGKEFA